MVTWSAESSRVPREQLVRDSLIRSMDGDGATPSRFLDLLDEATEAGLWEKLRDRHGQPFATFTRFVTTERPEGLGLHDKDDLRKHLALRHKEEREPYLRQATVERMAEMRQRVKVLLGEAQQPEQPYGTNQHTTGVRVTHSLIPGQPDTADRVLARLKRDDPDEAQRVISGETTANAAAKAKGWRKPRIVLASPERVAQKLRAHFTDPEQRRLLAEYLMKPES